MVSNLIHHTSLVDALLGEQAKLATAASRFAEWHSAHDAGQPTALRHYHELIPLSNPQPGEQFAFVVNLDQCTGCKACVAACHALNGLDDDESWRDVGVLLGDLHVPYQQTITSACHHCADPACANGCPVLAYDKDPVTGIVRHLDDQCIGCSYCILKCPYNVPKFNKKRGIVRKCDMCEQRLAVGEAPACVQSCPSHAIAIRIVKVNEVQRLPSLLPGTIASAYTQPTTRYISSKPVPQSAKSAGAATRRIEEAHTPLAVMLVLTQFATGVLLFSGDHAAMRWTGFAAALLGVLASVSHLGQPFKAWRCFLGWRKSWLSREILAFGALVPGAFAAALLPIPAWPVALIGLVSVFCSVMVYVDTRRPFWIMAQTAPKFFGTVIVLGLAMAAHWNVRIAVAASLVTLLRLAWEVGYLYAPQEEHVRTHLLLLGPLRGWLAARLAVGLLGAAAVIASPWLGLACLMVAECLERRLFFLAAAAWTMPTDS